MLRAPVRITFPLGKMMAFILFESPNTPIRNPLNNVGSYTASDPNMQRSAFTLILLPREKVLAMLCMSNACNFKLFLSSSIARAMLLFVFLSACIAAPMVLVPTHMMYPLEEIMHVAFGVLILWTRALNFLVLYSTSSMLRARCRRFSGVLSVADAVMLDMNSSIAAGSLMILLLLGCCVLVFSMCRGFIDIRWPLGLFQFIFEPFDALQTNLFSDVLYSATTL